MMHDYGPLVPSRCVAYPAAIPVTLQNRFPQAPEILLVLPFERVAGRTQAQGKHLRVPAWAVHDPLTTDPHFPASAT